MYLLSRLQKYAGMGRFVSAVTGFAALKGSSVFLTQMLRVLLSGLRKAMYFPSGEICAPEISGSPKNNSRSMIGGCCARAAGGRINRTTARIQKHLSGCVMGTSGLGGPIGLHARFHDGAHCLSPNKARGVSRSKQVGMEKSRESPVAKLCRACGLASYGLRWFWSFLPGVVACAGG